MKNILKVILFSIVLVGCLEVVKTKPPVDDRALIEGIMAAQEEEWNAGDLEKFMAPYWHSDSLTFVGKSGLNRGWQKTLDNYIKGYPDRAAMGRLKFTNLHMEPLGKEYYQVIGKWELTRDSLDNLSGHYSLIWQKIKGTWVIISDHSS